LDHHLGLDGGEGITSRMDWTLAVSGYEYYCDSHGYQCNRVALHVPVAHAKKKLNKILFLLSHHTSS
jgi:hypothetical protein